MAWRAGTPECARAAALPRLMRPVHGLVRTHRSSGSPCSYYTHTLDHVNLRPLRVAQVAATLPPESPRRTRALPVHHHHATVWQLVTPTSLDGEVDVPPVAPPIHSPRWQTKTSRAGLALSASAGRHWSPQGEVNPCPFLSPSKLPSATSNLHQTSSSR
jgi:hypothetical protein